MAEIFLYGDIGESWYWDEESLTGKTIRDQLALIPKGEPIALRINSGGGDVGEAITIYNLLSARSADITTYIDGYCCSAASFIALAGDEVVSPASSIWMIHNPATLAWGDAAEMRKVANVLDTHRDAVLGIYTSRTGKSEEEIITALDAETWFTGAEAQEFGLATKVVDDAPVVEQVLPKNLVAMAKKGDRQKLKKAGWQISAHRGSGRNLVAAQSKVEPPKVTETQEKNKVELQEQLDAANKQLEQVRADQALAVAARQQVEQRNETIATENESLKKEALIGQYWQMRANFSNALLLDNSITEEELYTHFSQDPKDDLKELAEMSAEDLAADLRARQRVFNKLSQRKPLDRVPEADRGKFQQTLQSKTVDGNPAVKVAVEQSTDKADSFLKTLPAPRSY